MDRLYFAMSSTPLCSGILSFPSARLSFLFHPSFYHPRDVAFRFPSFLPLSVAVLSLPGLRPVLLRSTVRFLVSRTLYLVQSHPQSLSFTVTTGTGGETGSEKDREREDRRIEIKATSQTRRLRPRLSVCGILCWNS